MQSNNQVVLIGVVTNDVSETLRKINGASTVNLILSVARPGQSHGTPADVVSCQFWDRQAEVLAQFCKEGLLLSVTGNLRIDTWEDEHGNRRQTVFIRAHQFEFLGSKREKING